MKYILILYLNQKKITKPPFRPVGKAPINNYEGGLNKYLGSTPVSTTRSQGSSRKKSSTYSYKNQSKFTSTPFHKTRESKPSAFPKINILKSPRRGTFDIQTPISIPKSKLSQNKTKSVKFDDSIVKISPNVNESYRKSLTPNATHLTIDELRRVSNAGRTPFSCTTSRSGSTPGRKDFPSTITQIDDTCDSAKSPRSPKNTSTSKLNRSKSSKLGCVPRWSLKKGSIIERDPYLLRERTPINRSRIDTTPKTSKTPNRSIGSRVGSTKKKNLKVVGDLFDQNFADVLVNTFDSNPALTRNIST
ncbi:hypothetical protein RF11_13821 [Thelohanellus kitauei]|uniref:Uncharacterized protein n=1 Tax=Thelohanellus kitauei TaxID=669202 RepID=A0A0C2M5U8_THEKT|nr:hypothetical protein RF11_13821 [Thelohanellus kitauei]